MPTRVVSAAAWSNGFGTSGPPGGTRHGAGHPPVGFCTDTACIAGALTRSSMSPVEFYAVRQRRGGPWDWTRDLRGQVGFEDHARFVDGLVDSGFIVLGGPLQGEREVLIIVNAPNEDVVRKRFADDPWVQSGMLTFTTVERWTILLDGLREGLPDPA